MIEENENDKHTANKVVKNVHTNDIEDKCS